MQASGEACEALWKETSPQKENERTRMKIIIILATGALITFTPDPRTNPDCFSKGYEVLEKIATYHGPEEKGRDQGWVLNDSKVQVGGWYCK